MIARSSRRSRSGDSRVSESDSGHCSQADSTADGMTFKTYGPSLLRALKLAVEKEALSFRDRRIVWALATHYADGQAMVTAALVVCHADDTSIEELVKGWEFHSTIDAPHRLDLPALSTLERLTMESNEDAPNKMGFELPKSDMGEDPFDDFQEVLSHLSALLAGRAVGVPKASPTWGSKLVGRARGWGARGAIEVHQEGHVARQARQDTGPASEVTTG